MSGRTNHLTDEIKVTSPVTARVPSLQDLLLEQLCYQHDQEKKETVGKEPPTAFQLIFAAYDYLFKIEDYNFVDEIPERIKPDSILVEMGLVTILKGIFKQYSYSPMSQMHELTIFSNSSAKAGLIKAVSDALAKLGELGLTLPPPDFLARLQEKIIQIQAYKKFVSQVSGQHHSRYPNSIYDQQNRVSAQYIYETFANKKEDHREHQLIKASQYELNELVELLLRAKWGKLHETNKTNERFLSSDFRADMMPGLCELIDDSSELTAEDKYDILKKFDVIHTTGLTKITNINFHPMFVTCFRGNLKVFQTMWDLAHNLQENQTPFTTLFLKELARANYVMFKMIYKLGNHPIGQFLLDQEQNIDNKLRMFIAGARGAYLAGNRREGKKLLQQALNLVKANNTAANHTKRIKLLHEAVNDSCFQIKANHTTKSTHLSHEPKIRFTEIKKEVDAMAEIKRDETPAIKSAKSS